MRRSDFLRKYARELEKKISGYSTVRVKHANSVRNAIEKELQKLFKQLEDERKIE